VTDKKKELNEIFDRCLEGLLTGSLTIDECLKQYPDHASELEPLLRTALSVEDAASIVPSPEMKAHIRYHLQLKMAHIGKPQPSNFRIWQQRWAIAVMSVLIVFLMGSGTVLASGGSMPGTPLYPIKIAAEKVRLSLAASPVSKAEIYATYADRRVVELGYLAEKGNVNTAQVDTLAKRYTYCVTQIDNLPLNGNNEDTPAVVMMPDITVNSAGDNGTSIGTDVITTDATMVSPSFTVAATTPPPQTTEEKITVGSTDMPTRAEIVKSTTETTAEDISSTEAALAKLTPVQREHLLAFFYRLSNSHPQELQKFLEKFPEKSRPAIRRMIEKAKTVYPQIVQKILASQNQEDK
jgi:hypothetical protein